MIDPNEAPEGFTAMEPTGYGGCSGCVFRIDGGGCSRTYGQETSCDENGRKDGHSIIFIKREEAQHPHYADNPDGLCRADVDEALNGIKELHRLRDEFAKEAMAGSQGRAMTETQMTQAACIAYWQADAMLAAKFSTMTWGQK